MEVITLSDIEQRAHDIALEFAKLCFELDKEKEYSADGSQDTLLVNFVSDYKAAYDYVQHDIT